MERSTGMRVPTNLPRRLSSIFNVAESSVALMPLPEDGIFAKTPMSRAVRIAEFCAVYTVEERGEGAFQVRVS